MGVFIVILFLFIPGYFFSLLFPWIRGFFSRIGYSIALSISLGVIVSFLCATLRFPIGISFLIFHITTAILFFLFFKDRTRIIVSEWRELHRRQKNFFLLFLVLSFAAGIFIAAPHFGYWWPIHGDEWWQVGTVQNVMEGKSLNTNPYLFNYFMNDKPGFSSYIGALMSVGMMDPIRTWPFLPAVNVFLITFVGSLFLFERTKKLLPAVAFPIFLIALRSNAYTLGWWFFVPSLFALFFVLVLFLSLSLWRGTRSGFLFAFLLFGALFLVYAPLGLFSLIALLPFLISYRSVLAYARTRVFLFLSALFAIIAIVVGGIYIATAISPYREYWIVNSFLPRPVIQAFFVPLAATSHFSSGSGLLGTVPFILLFAAGVGCIGIKKEPWKRAMCFGAFFGILNVFFAYAFGVSFLLFHQRTFYIFGVLAATLASSGVSLLFSEFRESRYAKHISLSRTRVIGVLFFLCFGFLLFSGYFTLPNGTLLYHLVEKEDLTAMAWLVKHRDEFGTMTVIANQVVGTLITPFTRMKSKISFLTAQNVAATINSQDILTAEEPNCEKKEKSIIRLEGDLIYAKSPQLCPFLKEIYTSPRVFIYLYSHT